MPVPKGKEKVYGKIVGHLQNLGYSLDEAKKKTDKAIKDHPDLMKRKMEKKRGAADDVLDKVFSKRKAEKNRSMMKRKIRSYQKRK